MAQWRKASASAANGCCVEISLPAWRKSTFSAANGCCVEVAMPGDVVLVRDSKDPDGPVLRVSRTAWAAFVDGVRR